MTPTQSVAVLVELVGAAVLAALALGLYLRGHWSPLLGSAILLLSAGAALHGLGAVGLLPALPLLSTALFISGGMMLLAVGLLTHRSQRQDEL